MLIKLVNRIIPLKNVKMIELLEENDEQKIVFYFIDGSRSICSKRTDEKDENFEEVWDILKNFPSFIKEV
jgi:hypothetical protein